MPDSDHMPRSVRILGVKRPECVQTVIRNECFAVLCIDSDEPPHMIALAFILVFFLVNALALLSEAF